MRFEANLLPETRVVEYRNTPHSPTRHIVHTTHVIPNTTIYRQSMYYNIQFIHTENPARNTLLGMRCGSVRPASSPFGALSNRVEDARAPDIFTLYYYYLYETQTYTNDIYIYISMKINSK